MQTPATTDVVKTRKPPRLRMCRLRLHFSRLLGDWHLARFNEFRQKGRPLFQCRGQCGRTSERCAKAHVVVSI
jgi:hypothetical protein